MPPSLGFTSQDMRDLQVWHNLSWFHELLFEQDAELKEFREKARDYTEADKQWLLAKQRDIVAQVIPLHKELQDSGQVELTTTPFYHPILPLLWDKRSARQAMPNCQLPNSLESYAEDAVRHIRTAVDLHEKLFGRKPRGMWPSEGSVSADILPAIIEAGIQWIATDEGILSRSLDGAIHRDGHKRINRPDLLYRPWRWEHQGQSLQLIFRDLGLSDFIGFEAQRQDPVSAAHTLLNSCAEVGRVIRRDKPDQPVIVPVVLDGENCWEHYRDGGVVFLRTLYREAVRHSDVRPMRICDHLEAAPAPERCTNSTREAGLTPTSTSGSAMRKTARGGTYYTSRGSFSSSRWPAESSIRPLSTRRGANSTSPKGATGSGGMATTVPQARMICSISSSGDTCRTSSVCSVRRRRTYCCVRFAASTRRVSTPSLVTCSR